MRAPDVTFADYQNLQVRLGTSRAVVVTPSTYSTDNRPVLEALDRLGASARGVVVLDPNSSDFELERLHGAGIRGVRLNLAQAGGNGLATMENLCAQVAPLGWHLQLFGAAATARRTAGASPLR